MTLNFAIPTWNRCEHLERCVESIASQIKDADTWITIQDHGSTDDTQAVIHRLAEKYEFVHSYVYPRGPDADYADAFQRLFMQDVGTWTWTFGDDDILMPGGLEAVQDALKRDFQFIHVSEKKRSASTGQLHSGTLFELCNAYGLLDMTGFITGNIVRTEFLNKASAVPSWGIYAKSAFVQSLALFEVLKGEKAAFIDWPIVDSQEADQTEETCRRWTQFDIPTRYFYLIDGLIDMRERGIVGTVNTSFFRYLSYYLWDRFCQNIVSSFTTTQDFKVTDMLLDLINRTLWLTDFLPSTEAKRYRAEIIEVQDAMENYSLCIERTFAAQAALDKALAPHGVERFPWNYIRSSEPQAKMLDRDNAFLRKA